MKCITFQKEHNELKMPREINGCQYEVKKKAKMMIVLSIIANLLSGCGFGETKIEYERLVKALDEGDMKTVMSASDDGYAYVKEETSDSTYEEKKMVNIADNISNNPWSI